MDNFSWLPPIDLPDWVAIGFVFLAIFYSCFLAYQDVCKKLAASLDSDNADFGCWVYHLRENAHIFDSLNGVELNRAISREIHDKMRKGEIHCWGRVASNNQPLQRIDAEYWDVGKIESVASGEIETLKTKNFKTKARNNSVGNVDIFVHLRVNIEQIKYDYPRKKFFRLRFGEQKNANP